MHFGNISIIEQLSYRTYFENNFTNNIIEDMPIFDTNFLFFSFKNYLTKLIMTFELTY